MAELKQYAAEPMAEVPEMKELIDKKIKEMAELKPCPFCHYEEDLRVLITNSGLYYVRCSNCFSRGPEELTKQQAIDAWNKRS